MYATGEPRIRLLEIRVAAGTIDPQQLVMRLAAQPLGKIRELSP
jgi:hypothetical protein